MAKTATKKTTKKSAPRKSTLAKKKKLRIAYLWGFNIVSDEEYTETLTKAKAKTLEAAHKERFAELLDEALASVEMPAGCDIVLLDTYHDNGLPYPSDAEGNVQRFNEPVKAPFPTAEEEIGMGSVEDLESQTAVQLRKMAKEEGLETKGLKKADLVKLLTEKLSG